MLTAFIVGITKNILDAQNHGYSNELLHGLNLISPTQPVHFPQNKFEHLVQEYATECGVNIHRGVELVGLKSIDSCAVNSLKSYQASLKHM